MPSNHDLYLDLMKRTLLFELWDENKLWRPAEIESKPFYKKWAVDRIVNHLEKTNRRIMEPVPFSDAERERGGDWPILAHTMIGRKRLDNLLNCCESVITDQVPGDFIETGVWRGGSCIFMRAILKAYDITDRTVWVADSFEGLPKPDSEAYPADLNDRHFTFDVLRVSLPEVQDNFERYGLLDRQVQFLKGWFKDTLPTAPIEKLAVLRLDGDMYESTWDALSNLYPRLSSGGFCIIDDYFLPGCEKAITDYRNQNGITEEIIDIDGLGSYWRRK
ncbi:MAG TPA: TylF/MycF family methyltransferase [Pyrinomonadaceae bacterium]|nr:TylF/MycF family methyltransferase [Pyrinomonadaceae bacterium]